MKSNFFLFLMSLLALVSCSKNNTSKEENKPKKVKYEVFMTDYSKGSIFISYLDKDSKSVFDFQLKNGSFIYEFETFGNFSASMQTHVKDLENNVVFEPEIPRTMRIYVDDKVVAEKITKETFEELQYFIPVKL
ncbi:MmpS family transport accessory protein [Capnocytophaga canis]|uniref:Lipoprotein n=1 Tax=Capnocytophaga canis TaxID=1848903 RepID=A0A0B7IS62_9FLAO|nr:MmpS family transport accessory protein [Capnocytophaga canis]CEN52798.1 exported hypothetical protein [Capnocytophaga canis]